MGGFSKAKNAAGGSSANAAAAAGTTAPAQSESTEGTASTEGVAEGTTEAGEGAVTGGDEQPAAGGGFNRGGAKRGPKPKADRVATAGVVNIQTEHGEFALPENSPMHAKLNAIGGALFGE